MLADIDKPQIIDKGDFIDLRCAKDTLVGIEPVTYIPLGVAMQLPKGCYAEVVSRSSTPKKSKIWCANAFGVIDWAYNGNNDEWKFPATTIGCEQTWVKRNERICQFSIHLSQKATVWQKLRWLFSNGIRLEFVDNLNNEDRGGIGTTGKY